MWIIEIRSLVPISNVNYPNEMKSGNRENSSCLARFSHIPTSWRNAVNIVCALHSHRLKVRIHAYTWFFIAIWLFDRKGRCAHIEYMDSIWYCSLIFLCVLKLTKTVAGILSLRRDELLFWFWLGGKSVKKSISQNKQLVASSS